MDILSTVPEKEPSNVTATKTESNQFTVRWGPPRGYEYNQDIRGYNVKYWRDTGREDDATTNNVTTATYTATGLDTNTVYTFRVAAYTEEGIGVYSEPVNISTIPTGKYSILIKYIDQNESSGDIYCR